MMNDKPMILIVSGESFGAAQRLRDLLEERGENVVPGHRLQVVDRLPEEQVDKIDQQIIEMMSQSVRARVEALLVRERPIQPHTHPGQVRIHRRKKGRS